MAGDLVVRQGQIAEAQSTGVHGDDGEGRRGPVAQVQCQPVAGTETQPVGREFTDRGWTSGRGETVERTTGDIRVPGAAETGGVTPWAVYLSRPTRTVVRTTSVAAETPGVARIFRATADGTPGP